MVSTKESKDKSVEQRSQKQTPANRVNWSLTKEQRQYNGTQIVSSTNGTRTEHLHAKKMNPDTDLTTFTKINWKWIIDLNVKNRTIKLLEDNKGEKLDDLEYGDAFFVTTPMTLSMKEKIDKLDLIKIQSFCSVKDDTKRIRREPQTGRKYLWKTYDKGLSSKIYEKLLKNSTIRKQ